MDPLAPYLPRIAQGDKQALAALYKALEKPVYRFIQSKLNDPFQSADILHDVFMEVWRSAGRFEGRSKVQTWVFGIAYRKAIDVHRQNRRHDLTADVPDTADDAPTPEACLAAGQEAAHVRHCLSTLKDDHRSVVTLAFYQDLAYAEIAQIAGIPEGTVKTRIYHAKQMLLRCLQGLVQRGHPA